MNRYNQTGGSNAFLMMFSCAGTVAGATWVVDDDGGADFASIQGAVDAAGAGVIEMRAMA